MPIQSRDHQLWLLWGRGSLTLAEAPLLVEVICDTKLLRWRFRRFMLVNPLCNISCGSRRCRQLFCFQEAIVSSESSQAKLLNVLRGRERLARQASAIDCSRILAFEDPQLRHFRGQSNHQNVVVGLDSQPFSPFLIRLRQLPYHFL
jgi:hypothetical protein